MLWSITWEMTWVTVGQMRRPPGEPTDMKELPSSRRTMVGLMEDRGRLPGSSLLTESRLVEKSCISSFMMKP